MKKGRNFPDVENRLDTYGLNIFPNRNHLLLYLSLQDSFKTHLYILGIVTVFLIIGEPKDAIFILIVILITSLIGGIEEYKAEESSRSLQKLIRTTSTVLRYNNIVEIDSEKVTIGDIVFLESGNKIPADIRLIETSSLEVDESTLTGESTPALKDENWKGEENTPIADRKKICVLLELQLQEAELKG